MEARIVQSLLARNRDSISIAEGYAANYKAEVDAYFAGGDGTLEEAHQMLKYYRQEKVNIAKLVEIQKALKQELRDIYEIERITEVF